MRVTIKVQGGCHGGNLRYEAEIDPGTIGVCHGTDCQRLTGARAARGKEP